MEMHMMFRRNTAKASEPSSSSRGKAAQITEITKMDDFIKFLGQDDRLCVVKWVRFDLDTMHSLASFNCNLFSHTLAIQNQKK